MQLLLVPKTENGDDGHFMIITVATQATVMRVVEAVSKIELQKSIYALVQCAQQCIDAQGTYFE